MRQDKGQCPCARQSRVQTEHGREGDGRRGNTMRGKGSGKEGCKRKERRAEERKNVEQDIELLVLMTGPLLPLSPPLCGRSLELEKDFVPPCVTSL